MCGQKLFWQCTAQSYRCNAETTATLKANQATRSWDQQETYKKETKEDEREKKKKKKKKKKQKQKQKQKQEQELKQKQKQNKRKTTGQRREDQEAKERHQSQDCLRQTQNILTM